jgi:CheY-like chemotaxis protein
MNILVVEESDVTHMIIRRELSEEFELVECEGTQEAQHEVEKNSFDLVLLANTLRSGNNYKFYKQLREDDATQDLPVIIMGTSGQESYYEEIFEAGANAFLEKPFGKEDLTELLMHLSSRTEFSRSKQILVVDDFPSVRKVLRNSLEEVEFSVREAENGQNGLETMRTEEPDLISVDLEMPVMDGFSMIQEIKNDPDFNLKNAFKTKGITVGVSRPARRCWKHWTSV